MTDTQHDQLLCSGCGAPHSHEQLRCWLCGSFEPAISQPAHRSVDSPSGLRQAPASAATFGLDTMMLTITLVAVCLGVGVMLPAVGILLAIVALPAYIRAIFTVYRRQRKGPRVGAGGKIEVFFVSLVVMTVVVIASSIAFVATCFPIGLFGVGVGGGTNTAGIIVFSAFAIGLAAAGVVAWWLTRWARRFG